MLIHSKNISSVHPSILRDLFKMKHAAIKFFLQDCNNMGEMMIVTYFVGKKKVQTFTSNMISTMLGGKALKNRKKMCHNYILQVVVR